MAGVSTKITLVDKMLSGLMKQLQAVDDLTNSLAQMDNTLSGIDGAAQFANMTDAVQKTAQSTENLTRAEEQAASEAERLEGIWNRIQGALTFAGLMQAGKKAISFIQGSLDAMNTQVQSEVQLATVLSNNRAYTQAADEVASLNEPIVNEVQVEASLSGQREVTQFKEALANLNTQTQNEVQLASVLSNSGSLSQAMNEISKISEPVASEMQLAAKVSGQNEAAQFAEALDSIDAKVVREALLTATVSGQDEVSQLKKTLSSLSTQAQSEAQLTATVSGQNTFALLGDLASAYNAQKPAEIEATASLANQNETEAQIQEIVHTLSEPVQKEIQLTTAVTNQNAALAQFEQLKQRAVDLGKTTTFGDEALIGGAAELATYIKDANAIEKIMGTLTDYAAGMGGPVADTRQMVEYATQLGKALDGSYDGLRKKGFVLSDAQKKIIELGSDMEKVEVITDVINQSWKGLAEQFAATPQGKIQQLQNTLGDVREEIGSRLSGEVVNLMSSLTSLASSPGAQMFINGFTNGLNVIMWLLTQLTSGVTWLSNAFTAGWGIINPILWGIATIIALTMIPQLELMTVKLWGMIPPILRQAAAWAAAHAPIILIGALIATLIFILQAAGVTAEDVLGFIGGLFGGLAAVILNMVINSMNWFIALAEFLINVFQHPVYSVKKLFVSLADGVLAQVQRIAEAMDAIFKTDFTSVVAGMRKSMENWLGETPEGYAVLKKIETVSVVDMAGAGAQIGRDFAGVLGDAFDSYTFNPESILNVDNIGSIDEIGRIKDEVNIADEDIKLLRDVAEARFVQNFVTLNTGVTMNGTTINKEADVDKMMDRLNDRLAADQEASAKGVYGL